MKSIEFVATKESIEELLKKGATYHMGATPQVGVNIVSWDSISNDLKEGLNLNNCRYINTMDCFELDGVEYNPIR